MALKYKVGDRVKIKSLDWYNENKDSNGNVVFSSKVPHFCWCVNVRTMFTKDMVKFCDKVVTIESVWTVNYSIVEGTYRHYFTDEMIECKVEEGTKPEFKVGDKITNGKDTLTILTLLSDKYVVEDTFGECGTLYFNTQDDWKLVEEETYDFLKTDKPNLPSVIDFMDMLDNEIKLPDGYIFKDENNNIIDTNKIILEKVNTLKIQSNNMETETHRGYCTTEEDTTNKSKKVAWFTFDDNDFADKVELNLLNRELIQEDGKWFVVKKKKEYPKTYEECCRIVNANPYIRLIYDLSDGQKYSYDADNLRLYENIRKLLICRDAYWKIAGEEMGLDGPWEPDWNNISDKYCIYFVSGDVWSKECQTRQCPFAFPTPEMRDAFKENFDPDIEFCKELL